MAAKNTTGQTKSKTGTTRKKSSKKNKNKKKSAVPFLLLIILILLGIIAYTYRDQLQVMYHSAKTAIDERKKSSDNQSDKNKKRFADKQNKQNKLQNKINQLEKKESTSTTVARPSATTTTTVRKVSTTTTTTTTVRKAATTTTTTTTTVRHSATTTTTVKQASVSANAAPAEKKPESKAAAKPEQKKEQPKEIKTRTSKVYFTKVTMDDAYLVSADRQVQYTDSPLTETIKVLLRGPTSAEDAKFILTNIPDGTKLLSARIANNIAYLDFSGEFENNFFGREATVYQLQQIVYTATEFNGVDAVQILINGKHQDYLGGEGILIGEPLRRQDFR